MPVVFVYGTLKRGDIRAHEMREQRFLGSATTAPRYRLYDCGDYPGLVEVVGAGGSIEGELYEVTDASLQRLDEVEGVEERLYARRPVRLLPPFEAHEAEAYFYLLPVEHLPDLGSRWERR